MSCAHRLVTKSEEIIDGKQVLPKMSEEGWDEGVRRTTKTKGSQDWISDLGSTLCLWGAMANADEHVRIFLWAPLPFQVTESPLRGTLSPLLSKWCFIQISIWQACIRCHQNDCALGTWLDFGVTNKSNGAIWKNLIGYWRRHCYQQVFVRRIRIKRVVKPEKGVMYFLSVVPKEGDWRDEAYEGALKTNASADSAVR